MTKADEMFKELGYTKIKHDDEIKYTYNFFQNDLYFNLEYKEIITGNNVVIPMGLLKAINEKCKELGWIDENE
jgi:hypothetical protein